MTVQAWVRCLERRGFRFTIQGKHLRVEAPPSLLKLHRAAMLKRRKGEIIRYLIDREAAALLRPRLRVIHPRGSRGPEYDDPMDYRRDPKTGEWIVDPGWWRRIPPGGGKRAS